ncbi:MAG: ZPR1 zinc finger domain-containing protein [Methanosphaera sp.]|nr:ZPR1 zinc finger domain-containing protein [Methanosphaera sp.]
MDEESFNNNDLMRTDCPVCKGKNTLVITNKTNNIPYFGDMLETSVSCSECGYQSADSIALEHNDPTRFTIQISNKKLNTRVAKSQTATITIPELGLKVEPGSKSQGYVSNVEGILARFEDAVTRALKLDDSSNPEIETNAARILEHIMFIRTGSMETTLILEDPFGNSVIDDEDAVMEILTPEEAEKLETGFINLDQDELV